MGRPPGVIFKAGLSTAFHDNCALLFISMKIVLYLCTASRNSQPNRSQLTIQSKNDNQSCYHVYQIHMRRTNVIQNQGSNWFVRWMTYRECIMPCNFLGTVFVKCVLIFVLGWNCIGQGTGINFVTCEQPLEAAFVCLFVLKWRKSGEAATKAKLLQYWFNHSLKMLDTK